MTIPNETNVPLVGGMPWPEQANLLTDLSSEDEADKYKKLADKYKKQAKKYKKKYERSEQRNAELEKSYCEARSERHLWKALSNSAPKVLQLISDVFNAFHKERMLDKQLSAKKGKKHKKGRKYYF